MWFFDAFIRSGYVSFEFVYHLAEQGEEEVEIVIDMFVLKWVFVSLDELKYIEEIELDECVEIMDDLHDVNVSVFFRGSLLDFKEKDEFHEDFLYFLADSDGSFSFFLSFFSECCEEIFRSDDFGDDILDEMVVGVDDEDLAKNVGHVDEFFGDFFIFCG